MTHTAAHRNVSQKWYSYVVLQTAIKSWAWADTGNINIDETP